ncbi:MAG: Gfo/Idh/MocA family oxidoreductase [Anaerolineales bacterium]|nr:Gfo/Idh/MocA family oxidoreductase [Anaerolineales bacterium]
MTNIEPVKVGVIGAGNISSIYLQNSTWLTPLDVIAIADLDHEKAASQAAKFNIPHVYTVEQLLADPAVEIVLNLTIPHAHGEVATAALKAGKSVYNEKPLALGREEAQQMLSLAQEHGLRLGCAPDTFLGAGLQTCRQLIDSGVIGRPVGATAFMMAPGHESWHPNPAFYYQPGGGPMFDMGPYYLTALIHLLGPVTAVAGMVATGQAQRTITSQPLAGQQIEVEVPTHVTGLLHFANGVVGTIVTSFDVPAHEHPPLEIYGTKATLSIPDPNTFGGEVRIKNARQEWQMIPHTHAYANNTRGLGLADMAAALPEPTRPHRANAEIAYHVLDLMWAFHEAAAQKQQIQLQSSCARPEPLPTGPIYGTPNL